MKKIKALVLIAGLIATLGNSQAAEKSILLSNGESLQVYFFTPEEVEFPPLVMHVASGSNNKFAVRAGFWLGRELLERGWAVAVPVSPEGRMYFVDNPHFFQEIIAALRADHKLHADKVIVSGISNGGSAALAIAAQQPETYAGIIAVPGRIWDEEKFQAMEGIEVYLRIGERDTYRWNNRLEGMTATLTAAGAEVDAAIVPGAKHIFSMDWESLQSWLDKLTQSAH
ncbi:MAG: alpha/beta hydrolase-fold protein [Gammaproteobacteria bacterium]|nr:alpha/beta hydrolase-fold protein [Gammaproteobacteria bacterium]MDD9894367.1 alpha/beta hydrolase-fold protein [Gammaproteobacteria bacterium]MDD9958380.1 alpha/beta hydrolase-fold protein [Gammaproteobacteria bacterium]